MFTIDLREKRMLVCGVANERSICWAITKALRSAGANVVLTYLPLMKERVEKLALSEGITELFP